MSNEAKKSSPASISKAEVVSNVDAGKNASLVNGIIRLTYHESILQDSVKAYIVYSDVGNAVDGKSVLEGLPLVGTEDFKLEMEDNNDQKLKLKMIVNTVVPLFEDSQKNVVSLELVSEEYIRNEMGESRCRNRYMDSKIEEHVERIFKDRLKTKKKLDIEETHNKYNFIGGNRKPFYMLNLISKQGIPKGGDGNSAGFLFFETADGYRFKSIEGLFKQKKKKSYVFNNSPDGIKGIPAGYDGKLLDHQSDSTINIQSKMSMGAYKTKIVLFDTYNCEYFVKEQTAEQVKKKVELAGKDLPKFNKKFDSAKHDFTRTTLYVVDSGSLPGGDTKQQIENNTEDNFKAISTLNQSIRRYNQLFSGMMEVTIAGDFSLHAGDVIFVDIFSVDAEKSDTVNKESGGLYIIADLCHYVSNDGTYTKMNLARDSFGRKGNHSNNR